MIKISHFSCCTRPLITFLLLITVLGMINSADMDRPAIAFTWLAIYLAKFCIEGLELEIEFLREALGEPEHVWVIDLFWWRKNR